MNMGATFSTISSGAIVRMQKNTLFLFTEEETFWWPMTRRSDCRGCQSTELFPVHARPTARAEGIRQMLQIFQKLQCLTDTSILAMICTRFIYVLTRNLNNHNPFLAYNRPFQLSTLPATAFRVCERGPSALETNIWIFLALYSP